MSERTPELIVLSRDRAERHEPSGTEICVSIADPSAPDVALSPRFAAVLRLRFHDIAREGGPEHVLFGDEHAAAILDFVARWPAAERIVIHCVGGASRSPAIALGLCDRNGWATDAIERRYPFWNSHVRAALAAAGQAPAGNAGDG